MKQMESGIWLEYTQDKIVEKDEGITVVEYNGEAPIILTNTNLLEDKDENNN